MIKHILHFLFIIFVCINISYAETISMDWLNTDGSIYQTTTCNAGEDVILPPPPEKRGYTFKGWEGYTLLEYIESTGTQYIDTGIVRNLSNKYRIVSDIYFFEVNARQLIGVGGFTYFGVVNGYYQITNSGTNHQDIIATPNKFIHFDTVFDCPSKRVSFNVDGNTGQGNANYSDQPEGGKFGLFNISSTSSYALVGRMSSFLLYTNDELVRDFIPAKRNSDNKVGMLDLVSKQFFTNQGTGEFIAGPAIGE